MEVFWKTLTSVSSLPWVLERQFTSLVIDVKGTIPHSMNFSFQSKPGFIFYLLCTVPLPSCFASLFPLGKKKNRVVGEGWGDIIKNTPLL